MMSNKTFFKPTNLYKEYMILDLIEKNSHITQRDMASNIGISLSMVNQYLDTYESNGLIKRKKYTSKTVEYMMTKKGVERRKLLNIWYLKSSLDVYLPAKDNIITFLNNIISKGYKKILLYGAGEVAELMIRVMNDDRSMPLEVLAVIDDRKDNNEYLIHVPIINKEHIGNYNHDGILISSYTHHEAIRNNLIELNYPKEHILEFFE
jgi:FlaA1/EpsC-like NDP-sugar epimerase